MFIESVKIGKRKNHEETLAKDTEIPLFNISLRKHTSASHQNNSQLGKKSRLKIIFEQANIHGVTQNKGKNIQLIKFENQYIKSLTTNQVNMDQRKQHIKERIKGKVKEQLADLLKRSDFITHSSLADMKIKEDFLSKSLLNVSVQGSSVQRAIKMSLSQKHQFHNMRKFTNKRMTKNQSLVPNKSSTGDPPLNQSAKGKRSLSHIIRIHNNSARKTSRNIHSALQDMNYPAKKDSVEIQPWQYNQDF